MKLHLSVGEIAKIVNIPPRTIRYYSKVELFVPSGTNQENGYHYYTIEKIEELRLIKYLRHLNIPIKEIKKHLENRDMDHYHEVLENQLNQTLDTIQELKYMSVRLKKRMESLDYIRSLTGTEEIKIKTFPERRILPLREPVNKILDWEIAMLKFESQADLPPSLFIGDIGFFVDLNALDTRHPTQFTGLYLLADEPYFNDNNLIETLPEGKWLSIHFKGDHQDAPIHYKKLMDYIESHQLKPMDYALERVLLDHYISGDPDLLITEIQIPLID